MSNTQSTDSTAGTLAPGYQWHLAPNSNASRCDLCGCLLRHLGTMGHHHHRAADPACTKERGWLKRTPRMRDWHLSWIRLGDRPQSEAEWAYGVTLARAILDRMPGIESITQREEDAPPPNSGGWPQLPAIATLVALRRAAPLVAAGFAICDAAKVLYMTQVKLQSACKAHRQIWDRQLTAAVELLRAMGINREAIEASARASWSPYLAGIMDQEEAARLGDRPQLTRRFREAPPIIRDRLQRAAAMLAQGKGIGEIAKAFGISTTAFRETRTRYAPHWKVELQRAGIDFEAMSPEVAPRAAYAIAGDEEPKRKIPPTARVLAGIRRATAMQAAGEQMRDIAGTLGIGFETLRDWQQRHHDHWQAEYNRAMEAAFILVRKQMGTAAVLEDPAAYLHSAVLCESWAAETGRSLFGPSDEPTVSSFFETYYVPVRLADCPPCTTKKFRNTIRYWRLISGDPPLKSITAAMLASFRNCLQKLPGMKTGSYLSPNTVRSHLRHLQAVLDRAGPPGPRYRDAAGILDKQAPWIKPPKEELPAPRIVMPKSLQDVYEAAACMEIPRFMGIKPAAWWRALLVVAFNTGLRNRSLFEMRMEFIDWEKCLVTLPPRRLKSRRVLSIHLNAAAMEHLRAIRTEREKVFPWPHSPRTFYRHFQRLQRMAGISKQDQFGLHTLRKTLATALWGDSPQAAQLALGHAGNAVTMKHYVQATGIVAEALDRVPQPWGKKATT